MSTLLARRLSDVKPSPSMLAKARVDGLRAAGRSIIDFTIGEPDFPTPAHIVRGGVDALMAGQTRYTSSAGTPALRRAIAAKLARENGLDVSSDHIVVGSGAKQVIFEALAATLNPGDEVVVAAPYWVSYPDMVVINGGTPVIARGEAAQGFKLTPAVLEAAITPRTRWLLLNTPNNPTGAVYTPAEMLALCEVLRRHPQVWIMSDEIYEHFVFDGAAHISPLQVAPDLSTRTLVVNGMSKSYAMTGWRIGYGAGPLPLVKAISMLISQSTSCPSAVGQAAAIVALEGPQDCVRQATAAFEERGALMTALLRAIDGIECVAPAGAFYVFPCVEGLIGRSTATGQVLRTDVDVAAYLLDQASVATIDGTSYGLSPHLRLSFATSIDLIEQGCAAIRDAVSALS
ncbi:pyridoxal phosphate-dependent aminotransferase [Acidovorax sp. sif0715]|uniref:pyridoxal phosphate-dependent aminotransferase n=1 Tax=unclassified Acidovorax TaxID=2684926 RepID=UPI00351D216F